MKLQATISNKTMMTVAALVIPSQILALILLHMTRNQHASDYIFGYAQSGVPVHATLGAVSSATVLVTLLLGLNKEPRKKVSGAIVCLIVPVIVLFQAIYFTAGWIKYG